MAFEYDSMSSCPVLPFHIWIFSMIKCIIWIYILLYEWLTLVPNRKKALASSSPSSLSAWSLHVFPVSAWNLPHSVSGVRLTGNPYPSNLIWINIGWIKGIEIMLNDQTANLHLTAWCSGNHLTTFLYGMNSLSRGWRLMIFPLAA